MNDYLLKRNLDDKEIFYNQIKDLLFEKDLVSSKYNRTLVENPCDLCIEITNRCFFSCKNCYCEKGNEFLSLDQFNEIVKSYQDHVMRICISGGEPTINPNLKNMIKRLNSVKNIGRILSTTGCNFTEELALLMKESFWTVAVSLHGKKETHNQYIGMNIYEQSLKALEILLKYGINIHLYSVLHNAMTVEDVEHLIKIKQQYHVSVLRFIKIRKFGVYQSEQSKIESIIERYLCDDIVYKIEKSNTFFVSAKMQERKTR